MLLRSERSISFLDKERPHITMLRIKNFQTLMIFALIIIEGLQIVHYLLYNDRLNSCIGTMIDTLNDSEVEVVARTMLISRGITFVDSRKESELNYEREDLEFQTLLGTTGPVVYVVTPTYRRPTQKADLTRLGQTLMNLDFVFWIVVEDGEVSL